MQYQDIVLTRAIGEDVVVSWSLLEKEDWQVCSEGFKKNERAVFILIHDQRSHGLFLQNSRRRTTSNSAEIFWEGLHGDSMMKFSRCETAKHMCFIGLAFHL